MKQLMGVAYAARFTRCVKQLNTVEDAIAPAPARAIETNWGLRHTPFQFYSECKVAECAQSTGKLRMPIVTYTNWGLIDLSTQRVDSCVPVKFSDKLLT